MTDMNKFLSDNREVLSAIYGSDAEYGAERIKKAVEAFTEKYGDGEFSVFSVPGRSEICGNHTDHNRGEVFAASINLDIIAVARKTEGKTVRLTSEGFGESVVDVSSLDVIPEQNGSPSSIIRGVCDGFVRNGHEICGFEAYLTSNVLGGSGLSSSAAFENMVGTIENHFANGGEVGYIELAQISQYAENVHFGKPCGLMDQIACASGGFVHIDFEDVSHPVCSQIPFDIAQNGYTLCIVATGGSHANLTDDYASVPAEMKKIAEYFGKTVLREITREDVIENVQKLREYAGDRAILRALHFFAENDRVREMHTALEKSDVDAFLDVVNRSGSSSARILQNYFTVKAPAEQGITLACTVAETILGGKGAVRVHGGGFAGTMQAFVPTEMLAEFTEKMEKSFGAGCVTALFVRPLGAIKIG